MSIETKKTLCTYEYPAASHDIATWRNSMEEYGHINEWVDMPDGSARVRLKGNEWMAIMPVKEAEGARACSNHASIMTISESHSWNKWIHFGKLRFDPATYRRIAARVSTIPAVSRASKALESEGI